jgi:hypothetical protein
VVDSLPPPLPTGVVEPPAALLPASLPPLLLPHAASKPTAMKDTHLIIGASAPCNILFMEFPLELACLSYEGQR